MPTFEYCLADKTIRKQFGNGTRTETPLQLIYFDICDPMSIRARYEALCFITFVYDFTCYDHVYLISHKLDERKNLDLSVSQVQIRLGICLTI